MEIIHLTMTPSIVTVYFPSQQAGTVIIHTDFVDPLLWAPQSLTKEEKEEDKQENRINLTCGTYI